jgi:SAM-dependent methyltransferase
MWQKLWLKQSWLKVDIMTKNEKWHDDDAFWTAFAPFMFDEERMAGTPLEVDQALVLLGLNAGAAVLDLGCGPGRHSLELARRGYGVTGVDRTAYFLEMARTAAKHEELDVEFVQADMLSFKRTNSFEGAISLFTSFGYFEEAAENLQVLKNIYHSLKPGGKLLLETIGKEVLARVFQERDWVEREGVFHLQERRVSKEWSWMENRSIFLEQGRRLEYSVSHWIYSARELSQLLSASGFSTVEVFDGLEGTPYDHKARRLAVLARKA